MFSDIPSTVILEILYGCNLVCPFCYVGSEKNARLTVPPLSLTIEILDIVEAAHVPEVVLLGGEPTLHPDFATICREVASRDFEARGIVTNCTNLNLEKVLLLKEADFWVDVSVRGPNMTTHGVAGGRSDSYEHFMTGLHLLQEHSIPVGLEYDCTTSNYDQLYQSVQTIKELGVDVKQVQLHRFIPSGDAARNLNLRPDLVQYQVVFEQMARIEDELGIPTIFEDGFPFCLVSPDYWDFIAVCGCGYSSLTIGLNGDVRHCVCGECLLGNVFETPIQDIWNGLPLLTYRGRSRHHAECLDCDLLDVCRGGCSSSGCIVSLDARDHFADEFRAQKVKSTRAPKTKIIFAQSIKNFDR